MLKLIVSTDHEDFDEIHVESPEIPRTGEYVTYGSVTYIVRAVKHHFYDDDSRDHIEIIVSKVFDDRVDENADDIDILINKGISF